jgi:signal transduction histidine kinase
MGIGLFQSRLIVEAHGGKIEAESEEGRGAIFLVVLPLGRE